ncbi:transcription initiation factor TFIID subunit 1 [Trichonephila clavipes]|nr:transcription initiation factor TFIID subunit 1 [Trichonephila clavipes]
MEEDDSISSDGSVPKSPSAVDYYDINELCEEDEPNNSSANDDYRESKNVVSEDIKTFVSMDLENNIYNRIKAVQENSACEMGISGKPLAAVRPVKYKNVNVSDLFSDFQDDKALRFLKLFGNGKPSSLPDIWRSVRKRASNNPITPQPLKELEVESDEEIKFMLHQEPTASSSTDRSSQDSKALNNGWRYGPAKLWYDMAEVPETAETYDYGFKLKNVSSEESETKDDLPPEAYLMVTQQQWEDEIIWDGEEVKEKVMKDVYTLEKRSGWIPVCADRTMSSFRERCKSITSQSDIHLKVPHINSNVIKDEEGRTQSMFPHESEKLKYDNWESCVIWDCEAMSTIPYPKPLEIDSDIIVEIPDDEPAPPDSSELIKDRKDKKFRPLLKKLDEEEEDSYATDLKHNFYNISNDEYYNSKITQENALKIGNCLLQHSIPALELRSQFFPTHFSKEELRRFHRPNLQDSPYGPTSRARFHGVNCLTRYIKQKELERLIESEASGGGEMFFMHNLADLSGKDGTLVLFEYSEEHPPLLNQIGMATRIKNYYRRKPGKDATMPNYKYGELAYAHTSPFLGTLHPGQSIQTFENNLFRAPIFEHELQNTDFIIIRTRTQFFVREAEGIYVVGQELPLVEVPAPKSEKANNFVRDFLMMFIYRLFWKSSDIPQRIKMEAVKTAFPMYKESSIRKRLSLCANFNRTGSDSKYWVLKNGFRLPSEEEIRELVSPEQCCTFYSMLAAEQRLQDAGYGEKFLLMAEDENDALQNKIMYEVKAAPWNTTQAFISAVKGKCLLELFGSADPTGCGEGFSYVKVPTKPQFTKDENNTQNPVKRLVKGTDADLRRLSLKSAKKLVKSYNVPERVIKSMTRWQIIDVIRTVSTEQAKMGEEAKFARGNLFSQAEHLRKFHEDCQGIFEVQNRTLSSTENLSSDEDSSTDDDSDLEEMGKHLENIISNKKSMQEFTHESEEAERKELQRLMNTDATGEEGQKDKLEQNETKTYDGQILRIYRTYRNAADGSQYVRTETVRKPEVIQMYLKIRESKDADFIRNYSLNEAQKEEIRKERRRLQDQLRRIKRNEQKINNREPPKKKARVETPQPSFKVKCGACGASGHMRTNRACPLYASSPSLPPIQVAMTEEQEEAEEKAALEDQNLIKIDETKLIVSKQLIKQADEIRRKSLVLKIPKEAVMGSSKKKRTYDEPSSDYLSTPKAVNRKRVDPVVSINLIFEKLIAELKSLPDTGPFWAPVNAKLAPNYYQKIKKPMDLLSMKEKARQHKYKSREEFILDVQQMIDNSALYNGKHSYLTITAERMLEQCYKRFEEKEDKLMDLEKAINPLLDSDQVAFSYLLNIIIREHLKTVPESWPFHKPVDKRVAKGYYTIIKNPMDLDTLIKNCDSRKYKTRSAFLSDVQLIHTNSAVFNGAASPYTKTAQEIVNACQVSLEMYGEQLKKLELGIKEMNNDSPVNSSKSSPERIKFVVKPINMPPQNTSNCNGNTDPNLFVDVESLDTGVKSSSEKDYSYFDMNGESLKNYRTEESNSSLFSPALNCDLELRSCDSTASPSVPTKIQSLLPINGISVSEASGGNNLENIFGPYSPNNCDTICDDLMLSESDSDDEVLQAVES